MAPPVVHGMRTNRAAARELPLVEGAIALVAGGAFPRVTLVSLTGGQPLVRVARALGLAAGVTIRTTPTAGAAAGRGAPMDLVVERDG